MNSSPSIGTDFKCPFPPRHGAKWASIKSALTASISRKGCSWQNTSKLDPLHDNEIAEFEVLKKFNLVTTDKLIKLDGEFVNNLNLESFEQFLVLVKKINSDQKTDYCYTEIFDTDSLRPFRAQGIDLLIRYGFTPSDVRDRDFHDWTLYCSDGTSFTFNLAYLEKKGPQFTAHIKSLIESNFQSKSLHFDGFSSSLIEMYCKDILIPTVSQFENYSFDELCNLLMAVKQLRDVDFQKSFIVKLMKSIQKPSDLEYLSKIYIDLPSELQGHFVETLKEPFMTFINDLIKQEPYTFYTEYINYFREIGALFTELSVVDKSHDTLEQIVDLCPNLTSMNLSQPSVERKLPEQLNRLSSLKIKLTEGGIRGSVLPSFPNLISLTINQKVPIDDTFINALPSLPCLEELRINFCGPLASHQISGFGGVKLKVLHLEHFSDQREMSYGTWDFLQLQEKLPKCHIFCIKTANHQITYKFQSSQKRQVLPAGGIVYLLKQGSVFFSANNFSIHKHPFFCDFRDFNLVVTPSLPIAYRACDSRQIFEYTSTNFESLNSLAKVVQNLFSTSEFQDKSGNQFEIVNPDRKVALYDQNTLFSNVSPIMPVDGKHRRLAKFPAENSNFDFWNNLLRDNASLLVMLGNPKENCSKYWPEVRKATEFFDRTGENFIRVSCILENKMELTPPHHVIFRKFEVLDTRIKMKTIINQLHIENLADGKGLDFVEHAKVNLSIKTLENQNQKSTTWLHCNTGGGSSGLVLASLMLDSIIQKMDSEVFFLSPLHLLWALRLQRPDVIETAEQLNSLLNFFHHACQVKTQKKLTQSAVS